MAERRSRQRLTSERLQAIRSRIASRESRSISRWATATALLLAVAAFAILQNLRALAVDTRPPAAAHIVFATIEGGASAAQQERLREVMLAALSLRRRLDPASQRTVRLDVVVRIGPKQPGMCRQWTGGQGPCDVRPTELLWVVSEGGRKLGTVRQANDIPDSYDPWDVIDSQVGLIAEGAVKGILKLVEDR
jgi:hypothetical protein